MSFYLPLTSSINITNPDDLYRDTNDALKLLIGGSKNVRLMDLNKGCSLIHYIFENNIGESIVRTKIQDQVSLYLPYVSLQGIKINKSIADSSLNNIEVKWTIPDVNEWVQTTVINKLD